MLTRFHGYMLGVVAAKGGDDQAVGELFQYLNESTVPLTDQEIRNAVYQGPFNSLVKNLAALPEFQSVISKSLNLRMEAAKLVVRFVAFHRNGPAGYAQTAENKLPKFLNDEMEYWRQPGNFTDERARRLRSAFMNAITLSTAVFGKDVFRKKAGAKAQPSKILFELVMCNFANRDAALVLSKAEEIREALFELCAKNTEFELAISRATGDRNNVTYRFEAWEAALTEILGPSLRMPDDQEFPTVGAWLEHLQPTCESAPEALPETCPPVARKGRPLRLALPRWLNPAGAAEPAPAKVHEA
jgi:hypothetical protein